MSKLIGLIEVNELEIGTDVMKNNNFLTSVNCPFPNLHTANRMFQNCSALTTFKSDLSSLVGGGEMFRGCNSLTTFTSDLSSLSDGTNMFRDCSSLKTIKANFDNLSLGINMFYNCKNLNRFECTAPNITDGYNMFRYCSSLSNDSFLTDNFTTYIVDGMGMFQGTAITHIPWTFSNLVRSRQMFYGCTNITGHLDLIMSRDFPNVSLANLEAAGIKPVWPAAHMFYNCSIASIDFDVSSLDEGISMFSYCDKLTECTGAVFQNRGNYQNMFSESKFDLESARTIFLAAEEANVQSLHIGIGFNFTEKPEFVAFATEYNLSMLTDDQSGRQWMNPKGNVVFVCNTPEHQTATISDGVTISNDTNHPLINHPPIID